MLKNVIDVGKLYEDYDDVELDGTSINSIILHKKFVGPITYDLCSDCCLEFIRWILDPSTEVREKVEMRLFADGEELLTVKPNGEIEWADQYEQMCIEEVSEDGEN